MRPRARGVVPKDRRPTSRGLAHSQALSGPSRFPHLLLFRGQFARLAAFQLFNAPAAPPRTNIPSTPTMRIFPMSEASVNTPGCANNQPTATQPIRHTKALSIATIFRIAFFTFTSLFRPTLASGVRLGFGSRQRPGSVTSAPQQSQMLNAASKRLSAAVSSLVCPVPHGCGLALRALQSKDFGWLTIT